MDSDRGANPDSGRDEGRSDRVRALLAQRLARAGAARERRGLVPGTGPGPVAPAQERMLFLTELDPGSTAYHLIFTLRLEGPLDAGALERALRGVEERHEVLRSVYERRDGAEVLVPRPVSFTLRRAELVLREGESADEAQDRVQRAEFGRPFDLREGPVWRGLLVRGGPAVHLLILTAHHIAFDGWSIDVLRGELLQGYAAELGAAQRPEAPAVRYADYAARQRRRLAAGEHREQLAYWTRRLADVPAPLELPTDRPVPRERTRPGGVVRALADPELTERVRAVARESAATPFMVLLACFQTLLSRYSGRPDIVVGTPVANRATPGTEPLIGLFVNTVVLRADCHPDLPFRDLLGQVRGDAAAAFSHQEVPFEQVVEALPPARDLATTPLFQMMFVWNQADRAPEVFGDAKVSHVPHPGAGTAKFDLTLEVGEQDHALELELEYDKELWDEATATRMLDHFLALTRAAVTDPGRRV
ncbi:condensation domain-containing protein, partial [Streptomyces sp. 150FB]|uniref:condensation domain-containing protein n=1 Tax=Streptomyces sp. 150FB TaxID=1576605 RepID=UPI001F47CEA3